MAIMAGMLPGVGRARRRPLRLRQGRSSSSPPCGARLAPSSSSCTYGAGGGHGPARLLGGPSSPAPKGRSGACAWTLDGSAREAKERLDQKLRARRESCVVVVKSKRHQSTGAAGRSSSLLQRPAAAGATPASCPCAVRRDVFSEPEEEGRRRWLSCWIIGLRRLARRGRRPQQAGAEACDECAVCLEELRAGDVVARLPCAHRFHWSCAVPWVQAASRCPVCRARADLDLDLVAGAGASPARSGSIEWWGSEGGVAVSGMRGRCTAGDAGAVRRVLPRPCGA
ncbi:hypothetical protein BS78_04G307400 [Paspalum vaginatum]|nr:hypothetical protein BS78_04G307400 [Paspalum vaginatum]